MGSSMTQQISWGFHQGVHGDSNHSELLIDLIVERHSSQRSVEASPQNRPEVTSDAASEVGRSASFGLQQVLNVAEAQPAICDSSGTRFPVRSSAAVLLR